MFKFIKVKDPTNQFDRTNIKIESDSLVLSDVLEDFADFLKACGYSFDGLEATYVETEEEKESGAV